MRFLEPGPIWGFCLVLCMVLFVEVAASQFSASSSSPAVEMAAAVGVGACVAVAALYTGICMALATLRC